MDIRPYLGLAPDWFRDGGDEGVIRYWDGTQVTKEMHWDGVQWVEWWQASDGEFYPPELHPSAQETAPAPVPTPPVPVPLPAPVTYVGPHVATREDLPSEFSSPARPRRRAKALGLSAIAAAVALVVGLIMGVGGTQSAQATVVNAVTSTIADKTADISFTMEASANGTTINATGTGGIDFTRNALQMSMTMNAGGQTLDLQADYLGGTVYENVPQISRIEPGKSWVSLDLSSIASTTGSGATGSLGIQGNPAEMLRMLAQDGSVVEPIGTSTVDGVQVDGYSVVISAATLRSELAKLPAWVQSQMTNVGISGIHYKVYVDGQGELRGVVVSLAVTADGTPVTMSETLDLSDYGTPVSVSAPPAAQTVSLQQFLQDTEQAPQ